MKAPSTLKGSVSFPENKGKLTYRMTFKYSDEEEFIALALDAVREEIKKMEMSFDELEENVDHLRLNVMATVCVRHGDCRHVKNMVSNIEFEFAREDPALPARIVEPPKPQPNPKPDLVKGAIQQKAEHLISVANTTRELLERYAPLMAEDAELREALTRLLENERIRQFDSGTGES